MHQLEELHRELDIAKAALAQLELAALLALRNVGFHPAAHGARILHEMFAGSRFPHLGPQRVHVAASELHISSNGAGLE